MRIAKRVTDSAKTKKTSTKRVLVDSIEAGLERKRAEKKRFFALADRLREAVDPGERKRLQKELAQMTFSTGSNTSLMPLVLNGHRF